MIKIRENQELRLSNVLSYRGRIRQNELENIGKDMEMKLNAVGAKRVAYPIVATYGVDKEYMDVEILVPMDKSTGDIGNFIYKEEIKIVNAVMMYYEGNPVGLQGACDELSQYIEDKKLQPITVGYNVTKNIDPVNIENTISNIYVGISPNIL